MPRRYHAYPPEFQVLNVLSTAGASILAVGYVLPLVYFCGRSYRGERAAPIRGARRVWSGRSRRRRRPRTSRATPIVTHGTHQYAPSKEVGIV